MKNIFHNEQASARQKDVYIRVNVHREIWHVIWRATVNSGFRIGRYFSCFSMK